MKILTSVLKDREIQNYMRENEDNSFVYLKNNLKLEAIYNYVTENINYFVVENNISASYEKIKNFSKNYTLSILHETDPNILDPELINKTGEGAAKLIDDAGGFWSSIKTFVGNQRDSIAEKFSNSVAYKKLLNLFSSVWDSDRIPVSLRGFFSRGIEHLETFYESSKSYFSGLAHGGIKGKLLLGAIATTLSFFGGVGAWFKFGGGSLESVQDSIASLAEKAAAKWESFKFNDIVDMAEEYFGGTDTSDLEKSSFFGSFVSFCDSSFEKLSSSASDMWEKAKDLAEQHPNIAVGILVISALGIVYSFAKKKPMANSNKRLSNSSRKLR